MGIHSNPGVNRWVYIAIQGFTGVYVGVHENTGVFMGIQGFTWVYKVYSSDSLGVTIWWETICELP